MVGEIDKILYRYFLMGLDTFRKYCWDLAVKKRVVSPLWPPSDKLLSETPRRPNKPCVYKVKRCIINSSKMHLGKIKMYSTESILTLIALL